VTPREVIDALTVARDDFVYPESTILVCFAKSGDRWSHHAAFCDSVSASSREQQMSRAGLLARLGKISWIYILFVTQDGIGKVRDAAMGVDSLSFLG